MTYAKDPRVDDYIDPLPAWQQAICQEVRDLVHAVDPEVVETIKRTVQPYFVLDGNICALQATKDHVNIFLYDPTVDDPDGIITRGHEAQDGAPDLDRRGRADQRSSARGDLPADHRQQPRRRLAKAPARRIGRPRVWTGIGLPSGSSVGDPFGRGRDERPSAVQDGCEPALDRRISFGGPTVSGLLVEEVAGDGVRAWFESRIQSVDRRWCFEPTDATVQPRRTRGICV